MNKADAPKDEGPDAGPLLERSIDLIVPLTLSVMFAVAMPIGFALAVAAAAFMGDLDSEWFASRWPLAPTEIALIIASLWICRRYQKVSEQLSKASWENVSFPRTPRYHQLEVLGSGGTIEPEAYRIRYE